MWYPEKLVGITGQIERIERPSKDAFRDYVARRTPVIIRGALDGGKAWPAWTNDYLKNCFGDAECEVYVSSAGPDCEGYASKGSTGADSAEEEHYAFVKMKLSECIERMSAPGQAAPLFWSNERYFLYRVPSRLFEPILRDWVAPEFLSAVGAVDESNLWISQPGNITPPHMDFAANLLTQIRGRKSVLLWDPSQWSNLYLTNIGQTPSRQSQVDIAKPDVAKYPLFLQARALEGVLDPGDGLYIPFGYIHCLYSDTFSILQEYIWGSRYLERAMGTITSGAMLAYCAHTPWVTCKVLVNGALRRLGYGMEAAQGSKRPSIIDSAVRLDSQVHQTRAAM
jgi:hypothetical protein